MDVGCRLQREVSNAAKGDYRGDQINTVHFPLSPLSKSLLIFNPIPPPCQDSPPLSHRCCVRQHKHRHRPLLECSLASLSSLSLPHKYHGHHQSTPRYPPRPPPPPYSPLHGAQRPHTSYHGPSHCSHPHSRRPSLPSVTRSWARHINPRSASGKTSTASLAATRRIKAATSSLGGGQRAAGSSATSRADHHSITHRTSYNASIL